MQRQGQLSYMMRALIITIAVALVVFTANPFQEATSKGLQRQYAKMDLNRALSPFITLQGQGMGQVEIDFVNSYDTINFDPNDKSLAISADFMETTRSIELPPMFSYTGTSGEGGKICVTKKGAEFFFEAGDCPTMQECGSGSMCNMRGTWSSPQHGYRCNNGTFTRQGFFEHYYESHDLSCGGRYFDFVEINRVGYPDSVIRTEVISTGPGPSTGPIWSDYGVMVAFSWECDDEEDVSDPYEVTVRIRQNYGTNDPVIAEKSYDCGDGPQHRRFSTMVPDSVSEQFYQDTGDRIEVKAEVFKPDGDDVMSDVKTIEIQEETTTSIASP